MRAVVVDRWMEPRELRVSEVAEPEVGPGTVEIEVKAAGCNFFDLLIVRGEYQHKPEFPFTPGAEAAGVVRSVGEGVTAFHPGDRVFANVSTGAYAERLVAPAASVRPLPRGMGFDEASGYPVVYPTSYAALVFRADLKAGETLLVHAAAGGVGLAAVQIGKALGARVIATAGSADKLEVARREGADEAISYRDEDWVDQVKALTSGRGADVIYDPVGGDVFDGSTRCIAWNGRLLVIGFASGRIPDIRANRILLKNISIVGVHWGAYAIHEPERIDETFAGLADLYEQGKIRPAVWKTYPLEELPAALEALGSRETFGKVVITP